MPDPDNMELVIVDSDPTCTARPVVESFMKKVIFNVKYDTYDKRRNIAEGRNRSVQLISFDPVLLIDDDQLLATDTLNKLRDFWAAQPETVSGAKLGVKYLFQSDVKWMKEIRGFNTLDIPDGQRIPGDHISTNGILVRKRIFNWRDDPFDVSMGYIGGSDTAFFAEAEARGELFVSCKSILIYEQVGPERTTINYILMRNFRQGMCYSMLKLKNKPILIKLKFLIEATLALVAAVILLVISIPLGKTKVFDRIALLVRQLGKISAIIGGRYEIYK